MSVAARQTPAEGSSSRAAPSRDSAVSILMAGDRPGTGAGNAVSSDVLLAALDQFANVDLLSHRVAMRPSWRVDAGHHRHQVLTIGTQPATVHCEGFAAGWLHRRRLLEWDCAWAVTSRYASALYASGLPYIVWEATTAHEELKAISIRSVRRNGNGTGLAATLHRALSPVDRIIERNIYRRAARLFAMGEYSRSLMLSQGIPDDRIEVLLSPPSVAFLQALASRSRADDGPPPNAAPRLLFVGRVTDPRKNADLLLEAFRSIRQAVPKATLTIVGRHTPQWREAAGVCAPDSGVILAGEVDVQALASAYVKHDLLLVSSHQEGYGLVVAEALHAGLPVVSTRCGGPEAILLASNGGLLVDHTSQSLADAALGVLSNSERWISHAQRGANFARRELSFDRFASRVADITRSVAARAAKQGPA